MISVLWWLLSHYLCFVCFVYLCIFYICWGPHSLTSSWYGWVWNAKQPRSFYMFGMFLWHTSSRTQGARQRKEDSKMSLFYIRSITMFTHAHMGRFNYYVVVIMYKRDMLPPPGNCRRRGCNGVVAVNND